MSFGARVSIRLSAIRHNFLIVKNRVPGARVMAVVKANAYGHGLIPVANCLSDADCLAVARLSEAVALRKAGIDAPIALLGGAFSATDMASALELDVELGVHSEVQLEWLEQYGSASATVWLKIDTGMNRLGFRPADTPTMIDRLLACPAVDELRVMTHFSHADDVRDSRTTEQIAEFNDSVRNFKGDIGIANSAGIFGWADELIRLMVLWLALVGSIAACRENRHIRIDALSHVLPETVVKVIRVLVDVFAAVVCGIIAVQAWRYLQVEIEYEFTVLVDSPAWIAHAIMPAAFALISYRFLVIAVRQAADFLPGSKIETEE